ncbi:MAG: 6-phosphofructokinase [Candidatus Lokiarchaeota archaeon]|nr:6-phosphofructokinase [Candidatus Lokiarchaeota archaeon]
MTKSIGILTGGGDVPGLNLAIKAVVLGALDDGYEVYGIRRGWRGLLHYDFDEPSTHDYYIKELTFEDVRTVDRTGGTFLHTSRTNPQRVRNDVIPDFLLNSPLGKKVDDKTTDFTSHVLNVLSEIGIDSLITIGGDDTLSFSARLHNEGFPVIGIPKTMDNDVLGTDYCIGFSTAVTRSVNLITDMRTSVGSHERIGVVELFGRNSGETSLITALLAHVDRAVISEVPFDINKLTGFLVDDKRRNPSNYAIMTVSEGAILKGGEIIEKGEADAFGHRKLGGIGKIIASEIKRISKNNTMYQRLGYVIRSGPADSIDRMVGTAYGNIALDLIKKNDSGKLTAIQDGKYTTVPLDMVISGKKQADVAAYYDKENYLPKVKNFLGHPMFLT